MRRPADGGAAGLRAADPPGTDLLGVALLGVALLGVALLAGEAGDEATEPPAEEPFAVEPDCFFLAAALPVGVGALPVGAGFEPVAFFAPDAAPPARGVDDGRAPEPRAEPEGRAGRREEGMG